MMISSFRDVEAYTYASVICPLKGLVVSLEVYTPIVEKGSPVEFQITRERVRGEYDHTYQRNIARESARTLIVIAGGMDYYIVVGEVLPSNRKVILYSGEISTWPKGRILFNSLHNALVDNTGFDKVVVKNTRRGIDVHIDKEGIRHD